MRNIQSILVSITVAVTAFACGSADADDIAAEGYGEPVATEEERAEQPDVATLSAEWNAAYEAAEQQKADVTCNGVVIPDKNFKKKIALTFDDGPIADTTVPVLEALDRHEAKGTFFVLGKNIPRNKNLMRAMEANGHLVANHSQNHLNLKLENFNTFKLEFATPQASLKAIGIKSKYFRFPYGNANCEQINYLKTQKVQYVGWNIDSADWCFAAGNGTCTKEVFKYVPDAYRTNFVGYVLAQAKATNGGVILFHDVNKLTASTIDTLLTSLKRAGFTFVRLDDKAIFPNLNKL